MYYLLMCFLSMESENYIKTGEMLKKNKKRIEFNLGWTYFCVVHINGSGE